MIAAIRTHFKTKKRQKKNQTRQQGETSPERAANQEQKEYSKYSETYIKRTPSIKRTVAKVPEFISLIFFKWNLY